MDTHSASFARVCLALVVAAFGLAACGGGGGGAAGPSIVADYYVDAASGSDAAAGTWTAPFKTLTHAISVAVAGESIHALPGTYDTANGELFPLVVPEQVALVGDEANKGAGTTPTIVRGGGVAPVQLASTTTAALFLRADSQLVGFVVINPVVPSAGYSVGVAVHGSDVVVRNCHVLDCVTAGMIYEKVSSGGELVGNVVARNPTGIHFGYGPNDGRVEANVVTENQTGAWCQYGEPDLGGGMGGSLGDNRIVQNTARDLMVSANRTLSAQNDYWDNAPPHVEVGTSVPGTDVYEIDNTVVVDTTGAALNTQAFMIPTFP